MRLSLSVEDTNRLRAKVGLRLIKDGPETLACAVTSSQRVQQLQARMIAADERAEERALHAAVAEGPALSSSSSESTMSWLERMKQKRVDTAGPQQVMDFPSTEHTTGAEPNESRKPEPAEPNDDHASEPVPRRSIARIARSALAHQTGKEDEIVALDPLDAPAEPRKEHVRRAEIDYEAKKTVFAPKRLKRASKPRVRTNDPPLTVVKDDDEAQTLESLLIQSRKEHWKRSEPLCGPMSDTPVTAMGSAANKGPESETSALAIGPTESFLQAVKRSNADAAVGPHGSQMGSMGPKQAEVLDQRRTLAAVGDGGEHKAAIDNHSASESASGSDQETTEVDAPNSVAETLRMLQSAQRIAPSSDKVAQSRRDWSKRLMSSRLAREADAASSVDSFKHLPAHERQKAYELHKKELATQDAAAAKELFQDYTPDVKFERHDEHGNTINSRQAFKLLSSAFHGGRGQTKKPENPRTTRRSVRP